MPPVLPQGLHDAKGRRSASTLRQDGGTSSPPLKFCSSEQKAFLILTLVIALRIDPLGNVGITKTRRRISDRDSEVRFVRRFHCSGDQGSRVSYNRLTLNSLNLPTLIISSYRAIIYFYLELTLS